MKCEIRQGIFDHFFLFHPTMCIPYLAWSGSQWVKASPQGLPLEGVQICNFQSEQEARDYCREHKLEPVNGISR